MIPLVKNPDVISSLYDTVEKKSNRNTHGKVLEHFENTGQKDFERKYMSTLEEQTCSTI